MHQEKITHMTNTLQAYKHVALQEAILELPDLHWAGASPHILAVI